ncbi:MAG TPA: hypothetical protein VIJ47_06740 [Acidimicrobiales bacterium]
MRATSSAVRVSVSAMVLGMTVALTGCSGGTRTAATTTTTTTTAAPAVSTSAVVGFEQRKEWARTANEWVTLAATSSGVSQAEVDFMDRHSADLGPTTNAAQMLVYGYDLCELYATSATTRDQVIQNWATANPLLAASAPALGADASHLLCP